MSLTTRNILNTRDIEGAFPRISPTIDRKYKEQGHIDSQRKLQKD